MESFTPVSALIGGALIGLSAVLLMALLGRVAGISGILGGFLTPWRNPADWGWRLAFVAGLAVAPLFSGLALDERPAIAFPLEGWPLVLGGLLVGFGTRLGSGCTSGHGVCGLARLSWRSLAATATFMAAGFATVASSDTWGRLC